MLVDELLQLSGKQIFDAYKQAPFEFKVEVLSYILDYPGVGKVFNVLGSGAYKACAWCQIQDKYLEISDLIMTLLQISHNSFEIQVKIFLNIQGTIIAL